MVEESTEHSIKIAFFIFSPFHGKNVLKRCFLTNGIQFNEGITELKTDHIQQITA